MLSSESGYSYCVLRRYGCNPITAIEVPSKLGLIRFSSCTDMYIFSAVLPAQRPLCTERLRLKALDRHTCYSMYVKSA